MHVVDQQHEGTGIESFGNQMQEGVEDVLASQALILFRLVVISLRELRQDLGSIRKLFRAQIIENPKSLVFALVQESHQDIGG